MLVELEQLRAEIRRLREAALTVMDRVGRAGVQGWTMQQFLDDGSVRELVDALAQPAPAPAEGQGQPCLYCGGTGTVNTFDGKDIGGNTAENWPGPCPKCQPDPAEEIEKLNTQPTDRKMHVRPGENQDDAAVREVDSPAQQPEPAKDRLREMTDEEADALIERVEDAVGMDKGAWDMTPGRELARSFAAALAASKGEVQK